MIQIRNLSKIYNTDSGQFKALENINLTIEDGDIFGIIGMSGAGKSTLLRCLNLLEHPTSGEIIIDGEEITERSSWSSAAIWAWCSRSSIS